MGLKPYRRSPLHPPRQPPQLVPPLLILLALEQDVLLPCLHLPAPFACLSFIVLGEPEPASTNIKEVGVEAGEKDGVAVCEGM